MRGLISSTTGLTRSSGGLRCIPSRALATVCTRSLTTTRPMVEGPAPLRTQYALSRSWRGFSQSSAALAKKAKSKGETGREGHRRPDKHVEVHKESKREAKKDSRDAKNATATPTEDGSGSFKYPLADPADPLNFQDVTSRWVKLDDHHLDVLKKIHSGGRFNTAIIGAVRVQPDRKLPQKTFPLRELADVIPRGGRNISLMCFEKAYVEPVRTAIQASPEFNQQPQVSADNELELLIKVELERPEELVRRVKDVCLEWRDKVRHSRAAREKVMEKWGKEGVVGVDLRRQATEMLKKMQKGKLDEIQKAETDTLAALKKAQSLG